VATVIKSERVSIEFKLEANETVLRESSIKIKNAGQEWYKLPALQGETLKTELLNGIEIGISDLKQALGHADTFIHS
jgi:hypothetical protein